MSDVSREDVDVVVIGAGFAGMYALHKVRDDLGLSTRVFEAGDGVGGTWHWNRYPGARCDIESLEYCYTFSEELYRSWTWTERYPTQPEIERYANHVADTLDLRRDIQFETRVTAASWDAVRSCWTVDTDDGERVSCRFLIAATGCLSAWQMPQFPGRDSFLGEQYHTGAWPKEGIDFAGKRVAVIGTGSSGVQSIPVIAEQAAHLTVFQRSASYSMPAGQAAIAEGAQEERKRNLTAWRDAAFQSHGGTLVTAATNRSALEDTREEAIARFEASWGVTGGFAMLGLYNDLTKSDEANQLISDFIRGKIRATVKDPDTAAALTPTDHPFGSKRVIIDTNYFETYNRDNVTLVPIRDNPIAALTPKGIRQQDGTEHELDVVVYATGYDAMTGALTRIDIRGREGRSLKDTWAAGAKTYLGLQVAGFPNLFTITGPGSPSVLASMMLAIQTHVEWIAEAIAYLRDRGLDTIETTEEAQESWAVHVAEVASETIYMKANSWFLGANVPGKPRVFMIYVGGFPAYRAKCAQVAADGYEGFTLGPLGTSDDAPAELDAQRRSHHAQFSASERPGGWAV